MNEAFREGGDFVRFKSGYLDSSGKRINPKVFVEGHRRDQVVLRVLDELLKEDQPDYQSALMYGEKEEGNVLRQPFAEVLARRIWKMEKNGRLCPTKIEDFG